ncbi:DUF305 domain-containing protein [Paractinoplanes rishiriensis]|uniref:DUF305 domain-containing protein n=1 Tax=Paractinoplanes rishiriensis TaxID=1050105 RepID=A0A919JSH7_9ACTN|nr:DUF305 domain-containing protein [Actinoplanes rishiriensis]
MTQTRENVRLANVKAVARVLLASLLALAGCSLLQPDPPAPTPSPVIQFGGTDRAWIEINIAMDESLLPLLELVPSRSGSPDVQAVALQVQAFTEAELSALRELHAQAGLPRVNPHKSMPMPGMVTPDQVSKAAKATGEEFDTLVLRALEEHLTQSRQLAGSEENSGAEPQTRALALQVIRTRDAALATIKEAA